MLRQNGISASEQSDMLRLDAMVMMVQLNIRNLLEVRSTWLHQAPRTVSPSVDSRLVGAGLTKLQRMAAFL